MSKAKLRAEAIDRFVTDAKAQGVYSALKAACILTGWDTLAGALTPLVGSAPTNNGFVAADYDRGGQGLKGNGSSKWLNSNRAGNADGQNDSHMAVYANTPNTAAIGVMIGSGRNAFTGTDQIANASPTSPTDLVVFSRLGTALGYDLVANAINATGFQGIARSEAAGYAARAKGATAAISRPSATPVADNVFVFDRNPQGASPAPTDARMSWYSLGSSVDLAALDTLVTRLMADLRAIEEDGMDRDALAYIRAVEAADGSFMVTGVKNAVDRLVKGLKYDKDSNGRSAWDAIGASCLLCGPRTIPGALVPLKGVAPTAYNFVSANYNQETGLVGDGATKFLDTNRVNNADPQDDNHLAVYATTVPTTAVSMLLSDGGFRSLYQQGVRLLGRANSSTLTIVDPGNVAGLMGVTRSQSGSQTTRAAGTSVTGAAASQTPSSLSLLVFRNPTGGALFTDARLAFYSIGASLSLSALDSRITKYVSDVAAAIP